MSKLTQIENALSQRIQLGIAGSMRICTASVIETSIESQQSRTVEKVVTDSPEEYREVAATDREAI